MKRFRELIAKNREERLRLQKNLLKVTRQIAKTTARAKDAMQKAKLTASAPANLQNLVTLYVRFSETVETIEARSSSAKKCLERLILRCQSCATRQMTPSEHATQLDGLRFEYFLLLKSQGVDEQQLEKYADLEELITLLNAAIQIST